MYVPSRWMRFDLTHFFHSEGKSNCKRKGKGTEIRRDKSVVEDYLKTVKTASGLSCDGSPGDRHKLHGDCKSRTGGAIRISWRLTSNGRYTDEERRPLHQAWRGRRFFFIRLALDQGLLPGGNEGARIAFFSFDQSLHFACTADESNGNNISVYAVSANKESYIPLCGGHKSEICKADVFYRRVALRSP